MNLNIFKFKKAFSLTELLIVLVVVAVLFAAMAPIMTKRRAGDTVANEPIWAYVNDDDQKDAFYDPGVPKWTSTAYFGVNPKDLTGNLAPYSKMLIKAKEEQAQIQFRYGTESGIGALVGLFAMDDSGNTLMTRRLNGKKDNNYYEILNNGNNNTVAGLGSFEKVKDAEAVTAIGANTIAGKSDSVINNTTAVGKNAGRYGLTAESIFLGANSGMNDNFNVTYTVAVGSKTLSAPGAGGSSNTLLGAFVGGDGFSSASKNTIAGSSYYGVSATNNTILGYGAYTAGPINAKSTTVAGVGACDSMNTSGDYSRRTCLGYHTAYNTGYKSASKGFGWETDKYDHIFIGGKPYGAMGGRAALEIHNIPRKATLAAKPKLGPTVVLNSHLVVRGNTYFPTYDGYLSPHGSAYTLPDDSSEAGKDRCGRRCVFGRKKWRNSAACSWLINLAAAIAGAALTLATGGTLGAVIGIGLASGMGSATIFSGSDYSRNKDGPSQSIMVLDHTKTCASPSVNYPSGNYCPNLNISDIRLKDNITENKDSIEKLLLIMPYNYTFKADKAETPQVGVMAQDLQKYFPQSVSEDDKGYLRIRWDEIFFTTINSVKSLDKIVVELTGDVNTIEKDTKTIAAEQKSVQKRINDITKRIDKLEK